MADDAKKVIDFNDYIGGEEAIQVSARALRSLKKDINDLSKTVGDDSGRIAAGFATIKQGIADIQSKAGKLNLFSGEDKAVLLALAQQLGELKKRQQEYRETQAAQVTIQRGLTDTAKQYTSELAKQKDALRAAALAGDVEGQRKAATAIRQTTSETTQLSKALRGANSEFTAAKGSYDALVIENNKLLASLHSLEGGLMSGSQEALKLKKQIYDNTQTLKDFDAETNRNFRNVGNYAQSFQGLIAELAKARAAQAGLTEGSAEAARQQMRIAGFQTAAQRAAAQAGLSYEQAEAKINGYTAAVQPLTTALVRLEREQEQLAKSTGEDTEAYRKIGFQIQQTKKEIDDVAAATVKVEGAQGGLGKQLGFTKEGLKDYVTQLAVGAIGLQALAQGAEAVFQANVEYSRNLAEVRKTTGLTANEAERLAQSLKALDTPTNLAGLLKIASVGGQLGIAKEDLLEFTKAIDTAVQALGNDFAGGAEEIATVLGKIGTVYRKELGPDAAQNILAIGSAINQLGAEGAATAPFLADVAQRTGAVASQANIGLKNVLAYAAVLEETGSSAEVAGTALNRLFSTLSTRTEAAYRIAQRANPALTLKEYTRLVNTDFNQAIQVFLKGLNAGNASTTQQAKLLATLKLQSGEAKNAILTLAANTDLFAQRQATANDQLRDATSLAKEASVNVENAAGSFDKLKTETEEIVTGGFLSTITKGLIDLVRFDLSLIAAPFREIGRGIDFIKEKLGISEKPLGDYTTSIVNNTLAARKQVAAQQELLKSYTTLSATASRSAAQELELAKTRGEILKQFGTEDTKAIQESIDKRKAAAESNIQFFKNDIKQYDDLIAKTQAKAAAAQNILNTAPRNQDGVLSSRAGQNAAEALRVAEKSLTEQQRQRAQAVAALLKLEGLKNQVVKDGTETTDEAAAAEERLGRAAVERAKNRLSGLQDSLADNQRNIDLLKKYQAEQGKLYEDGQLSNKAFAENVAGSQDLITKYERNGTAIRIKIARAEAVEKLAEAAKDRDRQLANDKLTSAERADIQGQYAERAVGIEQKKNRDILKANQDLRDQLKVEPLEFSVGTKSLEALNNKLKDFVKSYEYEYEQLKNIESARESELIGQLSRREISQNEYEDRSRDNRKKTNDALLALDKRYHKATLEEQKKANQDALDDQRYAIAKRIELIERIGSYTQSTENALYAIKGNFIDADIQRTQAAYDNEIKAAGENVALKMQIQEKYDKELKRLNFEKAKAERDAALYSILINTAVAVAKDLATYGFLGSIPFVIADVALGALQAATVYSKPLPQYFKGRKGGKAEFAEVAERGPELIERKATGKFEYVSTRAVAALGAGDNVYTADQTSAMLAQAGLNSNQAQQPAQLAAAMNGAAHGAAVARQAGEERGYHALAKNIDANTAALKKIKPVVVHVGPGSDASVQVSQQLTRYLNQRTFGRGGQQ